MAIPEKQIGPGVRPAPCGTAAAFRFSRREIAAGLVLFAAACAGRPPGATSSVLFVCRYGTVKSPVARELARRGASERGIVLNVASRGLSPEDHMTPELAAALARDGVDVAADPVRVLSMEDLERADIVVAFDPFPAPFNRRTARDWTDTPSMIADYAASRVILNKRIEGLLDEIAARGDAGKLKSAG